MDFLLPKFNYVLCVVLMMIGLWGMIAKSNLIKKIIGMAIFQTSIILFYISTSVKQGASIPILKDHSTAVDQAGNSVIYANPLPHVLMLTAIVVGVGTLGLALTLVQKIYKQYGTLEEEEIIEQLEGTDSMEKRVKTR